MDVDGIAVRAHSIQAQLGRRPSTSHSTSRPGSRRPSNASIMSGSGGARRPSTADAFGKGRHSQSLMADPGATASTKRRPSTGGSLMGSRRPSHSQGAAAPKQRAQTAGKKRPKSKTGRRARSAGVSRTTQAMASSYGGTLMVSAGVGEGDLDQSNFAVKEVQRRKQQNGGAKNMSDETARIFAAAKKLHDQETSYKAAGPSKEQVEEKNGTRFLKF